jgi:hypothetical protein
MVGSVVDELIARVEAEAAAPSEGGQVGQVQQLVIPGFPVEVGNTRFDLSNTKGLMTSQVLRHQQHVSGSFEGRVKGLKYVEVQGKLVARFDIEVLEATLD